MTESTPALEGHQVPESIENSEPFGFEAHRRTSVEQYQRVRPIYEAFAAVVRSILLQALRVANVNVASVDARAKSLESFGDKAAQPAEEDSTQPKYREPISEITDLAGIRVITFFLKTIEEVDRLITAQFEIREKSDKSDALVKQERLGYQSVHYLVQLKPNRTDLPEYAPYSGMIAEIQLRTVLQHAWAEIEHDIQYKSVETIPSSVRRRFLALAGLLEIADREFQAVQKEDEELRAAARLSVEQGDLAQVEITGDALKAYLDKRLGPDGRMATWSYETTARRLLRLGFYNFEQIDESIRPYNDDVLSRVVYGSRQGQLTRFEDMLLAALGETYIERSQYAGYEWWRTWKTGLLEKMKQGGIPIGHYDPLPDERTVQVAGSAHRWPIEALEAFADE